MEDMDNMHNSEKPDQNMERNTEQNSEQTGIKGDDSDFKYCMQDTEKVYIGARYSYAELMEDDHIPFKFQTIIEHYIAKDTSLDTTLESQLYYMKPDDFTCRTYEHLRAKVKFQSMKEKKDFIWRKENAVCRGNAAGRQFCRDQPGAEESIRGDNTRTCPV